MIGSIAGDVIGSVYEARPTKSYGFPLFSPGCAFTDDTVLTVAVASSILHKTNYADALGVFGERYPDAGYGGFFLDWLLSSDPKPYGSWGNGSAMRVSPVGYAFDTVEEVLREARKSAEVTHNHPEGIKGAEATALAVFMARTSCSRDDIRKEITARFGYDLSRTIDEIRPAYGFDGSCQGTVPEALIAFLESTDYEDAVRKAVSLGGDSDTLACIAGGMAEAFYKGVPDEIVREVRARLPGEFLSIIDEFDGRYGPAR